MSSKSFQYRHHNKGLYPSVPIKLLHLGKDLVVDGIVDSGSNYCIFHTWVADQLGIPWQRGRKLEISTVSEKVEIYILKVKMQVIGDPFECEIGFAKMGTSFNLLGRIGLFERHEITFNEKEKTIVLTEI
ncbi:MAG: hypothetical protein ABH863_01520 [Candidatus Micrarchaeota archaeon]